MARKIESKLRPVSDHLEYGAYRGCLDVDWTLVVGPRGHHVEMFGTWCVRCMQSYGWHHDLTYVRKMHRAFKKLGCPKCRK